jgi:electron transport complex protein RnfC
MTHKVISNVKKVERKVTMSVWIGSMQKHIEGFKELTTYNDIVNIAAPKEIFIPLINGVSTAFEVLVKEGDRVFVNTKVAVRNDRFEVPLFSPVSGVVKGIKKIMHASLKPVDHIVIENDELYESTISIPHLDLEKATKDEVIEFAKVAGIVGMGGAGFPTYFKYLTPATLKAVLINGVECEPYITSDYRMMENYTQDLITGFTAMMKMANAQEVHIAIKKSKKKLIKYIQEAIKPYPFASIKEVDDVYPMGWERTLVYAIYKKRYVKIPCEVNVIVNNATTAIALGQAITKQMGPTMKMVTVSGNGIKNPANVFVPVGTPASHIIAQLGGYTDENITLVAGGPMMGKTMTTDAWVVTPYTNAITITKTEQVDSMTCLRCGTCNDHCPAGLLPVRINNAEQAKNVDMIAQLNADLCIECGLCTYVCPSKLEVTEGVRRAKRVLALKKGA